MGIGPIFKKDVTQTGTNIEKGLKEYACILAFDVKVDAEAAAHADDLGRSVLFPFSSPGLLSFASDPNRLVAPIRPPD